VTVAAGEPELRAAGGGQSARTPAPGGTRALPVFPMSPQVRADRLPAPAMMTLPELLHRLPSGRDELFLSSSVPAAPLVRADGTRTRWEETTGEQAPGGPMRSTGRPSTESGTRSERGHDE
jgi:hypothetical protein